MMHASAGRGTGGRMPCLHLCFWFLLMITGT